MFCVKHFCLIIIFLSEVVPVAVQILFFPDLETIEAEYYTRLQGGDKFKDAALLHLIVALKNHFRQWLPQDLLELSILAPNHHVFSNRIFQTNTWREWRNIAINQLGESSPFIAENLTEHNVPENIAKGISLTMEKFGNDLEGEIKGLQHYLEVISTALSQPRSAPCMPMYHAYPSSFSLPTSQHTTMPSSTQFTGSFAHQNTLLPIPPPISTAFPLAAPAPTSSMESIARNEAMSKYGKKYDKTQFKWDGTQLVPQYCFAQNVKTVFEVVTEWRRGIDGGFAIEELNNTWSVAWRRHRDSVKTEYRRRKAIVDAITTIQEGQKKSEAIAIQMLEARYPEHINNVSTMARSY